MIAITLARKPLAKKTIAENVLEFGTGSLNIDESRIPYGESSKPGDVSGNNGAPVNNIYGNHYRTDYTAHLAGRFPSNLIILGVNEDLPEGYFKTFEVEEEL